MTDKYTLSLADPGATLETVGGKGASLAKLAGAGLPVPDGFHITTEAYRRFVAENNLQPAILEAMAAADPAQPSTLEAASSTIAGLFASAKVPEEIASAIKVAYFVLPGRGPAVAVRSSATAEDLPGMSFAGQQESFLNVRGEQAMLDAIRRCWASLWTARAIGYRMRMGIEHSSVAMAVVVQEMVPSESSGVLLTANPTTGERTEMVVNSSFGLGEAVVSGSVTPDSFLVDKENLTVKESRLGTKETEVVPGGEQGTVSREVSEERRGKPSLSQEQLRELARLALRVEALFGGVPQDIEWARSSSPLPGSEADIGRGALPRRPADAAAGHGALPYEPGESSHFPRGEGQGEGGFALLQARPVTSLPPAPLRGVTWEPPIPGSAWIRRQVVENMPEPLSPLFDELYLSEGLEYSMEGMQKVMGVPRRMIDTLFDRPMFATVNGFAYMRGNINMRWWSVPLLLPVVLGAMAIGITKILRNAGVVYWRDGAMPFYLTTVHQWKSVDAHGVSDEQLLDGVRELARADAVYWFAVALAMGTAKSTEVMLDRFLATALPGRRLSGGMFLRGFPSRALDAEAELEGIAARIRGSDELRETVATTPAHRLLDALEKSPQGQPVVEELRGYLERYGHQIYSLDFAVPTLADDPLPVMLSVKSLLGRPHRDIRAQQRAMAAERDRLVEETARSLDPIRRAAFLRLVRMAQGFAPYREESLFHMGAGWPTLRRLALELGRRLTEAGSLESPENVFFMDTGELMAASEARAAGKGRPDLAALARERRELREARKRLHPPAAVPLGFRWKLGPIDLAERESQRRDPGSGPILRGFAVSPGRVTAPASVVLSPADFEKMQPGTILVCPTTTPAWTPLFAQARGLVTDIGAVAAHGSIVAREYGIPAVMGTGNATRRVSGGQEITVDGDAGTVTLLPPEPREEASWEPPVAGTKWVRRNVAENLPEPLSPLFEELYLRDGMELSMDKVLKRTGYGDLYSDSDRPSTWFTTVNGYAYLLGSFKMTWGIALKSMAGVFGGGMIRAIFRHVPYWRDEALPAHQRTVERWKALDLSSAPDERLLDGIRELARAEAIYWGAANLAMNVARGGDMLLNRFMSTAMQGSGLSSALLLRGFPSKAIEAEAELQDIAEQIRASDDLREMVGSTPAERLPGAMEDYPGGKPIQERLQRYLDRYGHQVYNLDFAEPTQAEDPTPVLLSLKTQVQQPGVDVRARQAEMAREREGLVERTARSMDPLRRRLFLRVLRWAQSVSPYREDAFFYVGYAWPVLRRLALELGRRLAEAGSLNTPDDVFYLETGELLAASEARAAGQARRDLARLAQERRELREARKQLHPPAAVPPAARMKWGPIDLSGWETQRRNAGEGPVLTGFAVSPGRVTGPASVILSPADFDRMVPDTILVCPATTPAWTPLFAQAKGLITDIGGVTAHGSIVAREYGIPAVMGTGNGSQRIASGQMVTVDGDAGVVALDGDWSETPVPRTSATIWGGGRRLAVAAGAVVAGMILLRRRRKRS